MESNHRAIHRSKKDFFHAVFLDICFYTCHICPHVVSLFNQEYWHIHLTSPLDNDRAGMDIISSAEDRFWIMYTCSFRKLHLPAS